MILNLVPGILDTPNIAGKISFRHPDYQLRWWWREFYRISYLGGREYYKPSRISIDFQEPVTVVRTPEGQLPATDQAVAYDVNNIAVHSVLFRHNREKAWEYENRRKRAHYLNFIRPIVKSLVSHAMKKDPTREGPDALKEFWEGVDCEREESIGDFVKDGSRWAQVEGIMWACVDQNPAGDDKDPYAYWVSPLDIFDWGMTDDGKQIAWLKQFVYTEKQRTWSDPITPVYRFRVWSQTDVTTYEVGSNGGEKVVGRRAHAAGQVPFVPLFSQRDKESVFPDGIPIMADACKLANSVYNYSSLKDEIGYKQTFSWLAIPDKRIDAVQIGLNTCFGYDPGTTGGAVPVYVSPDPEQARVLMEYISSGIEQLRNMLGVGRGRQEGSMQKQSADALELESEDKRSILGDIAGEAQAFELKLAKLVMAYRSKSMMKADPEIKVKYAKDYDLRSFTDEVSEFLSFRNIGLSPEVDLKARQDLVRKHYTEQLPPDELDTLVASMTAKTPEPAPVPQNQLDTAIRNGRPADMDPGGGAAPAAKPNPPPAAAGKPPFGGGANKAA